MQRLGKNWWFVFLVYVLLNSPTAWANTYSTFPADSVQKPVSKSFPPVQEFHVVKPGDTYYQLARLYQVPVDSLIRWNGKNLLLGTKVRVGSVITRNAAPQSVPVAAEAMSATNTKTPLPVKNETPDTPEPGFKVDSVVSHSGSEIPSEVSSKGVQRILVIPFDPALYFSDADEDIALRSRLPRQDIRYIFRARLNAYLNPKGFETVKLSGGNGEQLNKINKSVSYSYQDVSFSKYNPAPATEKPVNSLAGWLQKQKSKLTGTAQPEAAGNTSVAHDERKYYGVQVRNPDFYTYFNASYGVDYYVFINQFEIRTDYSNCLDRTKNDFLREFQVHYNIFDADGQLVSGNKVKVSYVSNINDIEKIMHDNLPKISQRILDDLPRPQSPADTAPENAVE